MISVSRRLIAMTVVGALFIPAFVAGTAQVAVGRSSKPSNPYNFYDLDKAPKPNVSGKEIISGLEEFVSKYPLRHNGLPNNAASAEFLAEEARGYGFKTRVLQLEVGQQGAIPRTVRVIEAVKKGTQKPDEWIAMVAHYDAVAPDGVGMTIEGAYDPASGANMLRYFGKAFSKVKTKRSIALLWFDAEENGLLASKAYVDQVMAKRKSSEIVAAFGFDMVGIAYPAPYCMCVYHGTNIPGDAELGVPIIDYVNFQHLKFPEGDGAPSQAMWPRGVEGHVCNCGPNIRNSDESSLAKAGVFTLRWTGMRRASDYPGYHMPFDTVPFMEAIAGSRENLEKGTENTFNSAWYTTFVVDNLKNL